PQPAPPADKPLPAEERPSPAVAGDIRSATPYVFSPLKGRLVLLRAVSGVCLVALDLCGLTIALYSALALREVYYGSSPILWGILWRDALPDYLPFVALVTVLVFWQAGQYAPREQGGGFGCGFVGAVAASPGGVDLPVLGQGGDLQAILAKHQVDELVVTDSDFSERDLLEMVEHAHRSGVKVRIAPKATELLTQRAEYIPGQGAP